MKYVNIFLERFKNTPAFTFKDVKKLLDSKGSTAAYAKVFMKNMLKSGRAHRITKGSYSLYKEMEVVGFPFSPFYYGLGFALTYHGLWKQQSNPHVITTRNVRGGTRRTFGLNFQISKISRDMFFGYTHVKGKNFYYPVSDVEKTLIDTLYYGLNLEDYVYANIFKVLDRKKIRLYLKRCNGRVNAKYQKLSYGS